MDIQKLFEFEISQLKDDDPEDDIDPYSAMESFQNLESKLEKKDITPKAEHILDNLISCKNDLESIVTETQMDTALWEQLYQIQEQILKIAKFLEITLENSELLFRSRKIFLKNNEIDYNQVSHNEDIKKLMKEIIEIPRIKGLEQIAGLWEIKRILKSFIILPRNQPQLFANNKICNSILLFGPPGTGKTQLVHALAYEAKATLYSVNISNILSPMVGQSEKNLRYLFEFIKQSKGFSILFIDEVDGLCKRRNDTEQEHSRRLKTELMCHLSKIGEYTNMCLICNTNCPWDLDNAFLRRFHKRFYIPLPSSTERNELLKLFLRDCQVNINCDIWQHLIDNTEGFSGSDLHNLVQEAKNISILELEDTKIWKMSDDGFYEPVTRAEDFNLKDIRCCELTDLPYGTVRARSIETVDFLSTLDKTQISVSKADIKKYEDFANIKKQYL